MSYSPSPITPIVYTTSNNPAVALKLKNFKAAMRLPNMKAFGLMAASQDLSWIANAASNSYAPNLTLISTGVYVMTDPASGALVAPSGGVDVYVNGIHLTPGLGYAITGAYITFLSGYVPGMGDLIRVQYENAPSVGGFGAAMLGYIQLVGTQDGVNLVFTIPLNFRFAAIFRNGVLLTLGSDYTLAGSVVTMTVFPPLPTDTLGVFYSV